MREPQTRLQAIPTDADLPAWPDPSRTVLLLDFDGTLVDIADRPDAVIVPAELVQLLNDLHAATSGATVLVSGRKIADIEGFLPEFAGLVIGSHGAEWRDGAERRQHPAVGSDALAAIKSAVGAWAEAAPGVLVEDKPASIVLHFRQAPERLAEAKHALAGIAESHPGFVLHEAKMALELHPSDVSKAAAVERLLPRWPTRTPVAAGDDATDEGMFRAALDAGGQAIKIGDGESCAPHRLATPRALRDRLSAWLETPEEDL